MRVKYLALFMRVWSKGDARATAGGRPAPIAAHGAGSHYEYMRLLLPQLDRERPKYMIKEYALARLISTAWNLPPDLRDKLEGWKNPFGGQRYAHGAARRARRAEAGGKRELGEENPLLGSFSLVVFEVLKGRCQVGGTLTVADVNGLLDELASVGENEVRADVHAKVMKAIFESASAVEVKWLASIIVKDVKCNLGWESILRTYHQDALALFNHNANLRGVCEALQSADRMDRQDLTVGTPFRPQLAGRCNSTAEVVDTFKGAKDFSIEVKYDGERVTIHKNGENVQYFSRNFHDMTDTFGPHLTDLVRRCVRKTKCILDGELCAWHDSEGTFAPFGLGRMLIAQMRPGYSLFYVAYDILYDEVHSVIHLPLRERQRLLREAIPEGEAHRFEALRGCQISSELTMIEEAFQQAIVNQEEGIIVKDLDSPWIPGNRPSRGHWQKIKPDYLEGAKDFDCIIIGGYYGRGRRGGKMGSFLVGIAESRPVDFDERSAGQPNVWPREILSFTKVGGGFDDDTLSALSREFEVLSPGVPELPDRSYAYPFDPKEPSPQCKRLLKCYNPLAGRIVLSSQRSNSKECPDVLIDPERSIVLTIASEVRLISNEVYRVPYTLRFPRCTALRRDKMWWDIETIQDVRRYVSEAATREGIEVDSKGAIFKKKVKRGDAAAGGSRRKAAILPNLMPATTGKVEVQDEVFGGHRFLLLPEDDQASNGEAWRTRMETLVKQHAGDVVLNRIALEPRDAVHAGENLVVAQSAGGNAVELFLGNDERDVLSSAYVHECLAAGGTFVPKRPRHYLHMSASTREAFRAQTDEFGLAWGDALSGDELGHALRTMKMRGGAPSPGAISGQALLRDKVVDFSDIPGRMMAGCTVLFPGLTDAYSAFPDVGDSRHSGCDPSQVRPGVPLHGWHAFRDQTALRTAYNEVTFEQGKALTVAEAREAGELGSVTHIVMLDDRSPSPDYAERVARERDAIAQSTAHGAATVAATWVVRSVLDGKRLPPDAYLCTPPPPLPS